MHVINKIKLDLTKPDPTLTVNAVQGEAYSRSLQISLFREHHPWTIPEHITATVRYVKPDHTKGYYDTLPDGTSAWSVQENLLTVQLAPQMLTVPGSVKALIQLIQGTHILSTFSLTVYVEADPAAGIVQSENYINWLQWIEDQAEDQVSLTQQAANTACQASQAATLAANAAANARKESETIAATVSSIVAGNEAYTKIQSDHRYASVILPTASGCSISLSDATNWELQGLHLFGKTTQPSTPTPENPMMPVSLGAGGNLEVVLSGKNLLLEDIAGTYTGNNTTMEIVPDMRIAGGFIPNTQYTLSLCHSKKDIVTTSAGNLLYFKISYTDGTDDYYGLTDTSARYFSYVSRPGKTLRKIAFTRHSRWTGGTITITQVQIEMGASATDWEARKEIQTLSVPTPNGLPGIPVISDGNYTDENGQQWICDEVDFGRGVYVQRIRVTTVDSTAITQSDFGDNIFVYQFNDGLIAAYNYSRPYCSCYQYEATENVAMLNNYAFQIRQISSPRNAMYFRDDRFTTLADIRDYLSEKPFTFQYILSTPVEIALSNEVLAAYATLHTVSPNTTVSSSGASTEVRYLADSMLYIDNQIQRFIVSSN